MLTSMMPTDAAEHHGNSNSSDQATSLSPILSFPRATFNALLAAATRQSSSTDSEERSPPELEKKNKDAVKASSAVTSMASTPKLESRPSTSSGSIVSAADTTVGVKGKRRPPRRKTQYSLCHPVTASRQKQKLHLRPRVLLQLHRATTGSRPRPAFEVIPALRCAPRIGSHKFTRVLRALDRGPDDLVVMKAEQYGRLPDADDSDEEGSDREAIGVICVDTERNGDTVNEKTEIIMDNGVIWTATNVGTGRYDFTAVDEHGLQMKARWVARNSLNRRDSSLQRFSAAINGQPPDERRFTFSTISHGSRRHPVIATMTRQSIEVMDQYTMPLRSPTDSPVATPAVTPSVHDIEADDDSYMNIRNKIESVPIDTDETLHKFILVTGIWVAFRENWSAVFRYASPQSPLNTPLPGSPSTHRPSAPQRAVSMPPVETKLHNGSSALEDSRRFPRPLRTGSSLLKRSSPSLNGSSPFASAPTSPKLPKTRARRSNSTGNAVLRRFEPPPNHEDLLESPEEEEQKYGSLGSDTGYSTPRKNSIPPVQISEVKLPSCDGAEHDDAPRQNKILNEPALTPRVQSAYLSPESTSRLWDSGDPPSTKSPKKGRSWLKDRPKSIQHVSELKIDKEKPKISRLRRMFSVIRGEKDK